MKTKEEEIKLKLGEIIYQGGKRYIVRGCSGDGDGLWGERIEEMRDIISPRPYHYETS